MPDAAAESRSAAVLPTFDALLIAARADLAAHDRRVTYAGLGLAATRTLDVCRATVSCYRRQIDQHKHDDTVGSAAEAE
jgi:hypothetical protein